MDNNEILELTTSAWREKVYIETAEYIIRGYVFMPKIGKEKHKQITLNKTIWTD